MSLLDRYARLRETVRFGRVHTRPKEVLAFLKGRIGKNDLPAAVVEPAGENEVRAVLEFAAAKRMRVAVASGLKPVEVRGLGGGILVLTTRFAGAPVFSASRRSVRVEAGLPAESLAVDLSRAGLRWGPLFPVPAGTSPGELLALGWEGLSNWQGGGFLSHVRAVKWIAYDGRCYCTGPECADENAPDVSGFLFGSRGALGIITALDLDLQPVPRERTAALLELPDALAAVELLAELRNVEPLPETVAYWGEAATQVLREGTDQRVSEQAAVLLAVEWGQTFASWPDRWGCWGLPLTQESAAAALWQDLFRFPRIVARLYPERTGARLKLPAQSVAALEEAARDLGHDSNLPVALWGTLDAGHLQVWILQADGEPRTVRRAEELLRRICEVAAGLGGRPAPGSVLPFDTRPVFPEADGSPLAESIRTRLRERCDPAGLYVPLAGA